MTRQVPYIIVLFLAVLCAAGFAQERSILIGAGNRLVDTELRDGALRLIRHRIETGVAVEPLLIFGPFADPDVLGSIATDENLALPFREIAANAILDQLYIANPYFRAAAEHYLNILLRSPERSIRLKGWVGGAILEYRLYAIDALEEGRRLVQLRYSASRETDPRLRQLLDELNEGDPSALIGSAAWSSDLAAQKPYRRFDVIQNFSLDGEEDDETWIAKAWERHKKVRTSLDSFMATEPATGTTVNSAVTTTSLSTTEATVPFKKFSNSELAGFLSRFAATEPVQADSFTLASKYAEFFGQLARKKPDPYIRALALGPLRFASRDVAVETFVDMLRSDRSPLVRLSCAETLGSYADDRDVRSRMIAVFRIEEDARVRLHILYGLVSPDPTNLAPDVQAFLLARLREEDDAEVLAFAVHALGTARTRSAAGLFSRMLTTSRDPILRARVADALARLGLGTRLRSLENPKR